VCQWGTSGLRDCRRGGGFHSSGDKAVLFFLGVRVFMFMYRLPEGSSREASVDPHFLRKKEAFVGFSSPGT